jgi:hypothetical protein
MKSMRTVRKEKARKTRKSTIRSGTTETGMPAEK